MFKKILIALLSIIPNIVYSSASTNQLKAAYIYQITKYAIEGYNPTTYCINDVNIAERLYDTNKPITVNNEYVVDCEVLFNYNSAFALTFTDREENKEDYMFYFAKENDKLVVYRNLQKTNNLHIKGKYLSIMKTY